jgi:UDP-N-acetylmuramate dehydrogenase
MTTSPIPRCIRSNVILTECVYYRIGGVARYFGEPDTFAEVREVVLWARKNELPFAYLGAGSNSLFSDEAFAGVIISFANLCAWHWETDSVLYAEAGVENSAIAAACLRAGRKGAAWMHKLPGQVGATTRMNARCYSGEMSQIVSHVLSIDIDGNLITRPSAEVFLGYKETTYMKNGEAIVAVRFSFPESESVLELSNAMSDCEIDRDNKHHFEAPSCGSTFKNNYAVGVPSGRIFDELGFRGQHEGGAKVSLHHANFIQNTGNATAKDVLTLAARMRKAAADHKNAVLDLEVEAIGSFDLSLISACGISSACQSKAKCMAGLAWAPNVDIPANAFPKTLFSAPFIEYFRKPCAGETNILATVTQLLPLSEAIRNPEEPFLRWQTSAESNLHTIFSHMPKAPRNSFVNELWEYSVSEIFFAAPNSQQYDEYEMTPEQHWIAIAHHGKRLRKPGHENPSARFWPNASPWGNKHNFGMDFPYAAIAHLVENRAISLQCCLSVGNGSYHLAPHWMNLRNEPSGVWKDDTPPNVKADFHQPERFWKVTLAEQ